MLNLSNPFRLSHLEKIPLVISAFIAGIAFALKFFVGFNYYFYLFLGLFFAAIFLFFLNKKTASYFAISLVLAFLAGGFYYQFYQKFIENEQKITGVIYVDVVGKIAAVKPFFNKKNSQKGLFLTLKQVKLYKNGEILQKNGKKTVKKLKKRPKKPKKYKKISKFSKSEQKNLLNIPFYQEIDREFLNLKANYQEIIWDIDDEGKKIVKNAPKQIAVSWVKASSNLKVNDKIAFKARLNEPQKKEFINGFDFALNARAKNIGAYGYVIGQVKILAKGKINNFDEFILAIRQKIENSLEQNLSQNAPLAKAFLIGKKDDINDKYYQKIREVGLAHLLAISGFHLSLAALIFFVIFRYFLAKNEYLTLNFDLKKIAYFLALFAAYFYLRISGSHLPAQRAFLMIFLVFLALLFNEKINFNRGIIFAALILVLLNPYLIFTVSFQLSFVAILAVSFFAKSDFSIKINNYFKGGFLNKFSNYFVQIICLSLFVQIVTLPFLIYYFSGAAIFSFIANFFAIPLVSFLLMPLGFLSLFFMSFGLEKYPLFLFNQSLNYFNNIVYLVHDLTFFKLNNLSFSGHFLAVFIVAILLFFFAKKSFRILGLAIFLMSFFALFFNQKADIAFDGKQRFFVIYDQEDSLIFSKKIRSQKIQDLWRKKFAVSKVKYLEDQKIAGVFCNKLFCEINKNSQKILVLIGRNKIEKICDNNFDILVNLSKKYQIPDCVKQDKKLIDNADFWHKSTHFLFLKRDDVVVKSVY